MKYFTCFLLTLFAYNAFADSCPDFSGTYAIQDIGIVTIEQVNCEQISTSLQGAGTEVRIADGQFRKVIDPAGKTLISSTVFSETRLIMEQKDPTNTFIEIKSNYRKAGNNIIASNFYYDHAGNKIYTSAVLFEKIQ